VKALMTGKSSPAWIVYVHPAVVVFNEGETEMLSGVFNKRGPPRRALDASDAGILRVGEALHMPLTEYVRERGSGPCQGVTAADTARPSSPVLLPFFLLQPVSTGSSSVYICRRPRSPA
jgi:hypothetical protein